MKHHSKRSGSVITRVHHYSRKSGGDTLFKKEREWCIIHIGEGATHHKKSGNETSFQKKRGRYIIWKGAGVIYHSKRSNAPINRFWSDWKIGYFHVEKECSTSLQTPRFWIFARYSFLDRYLLEMVSNE